MPPCYAGPGPVLPRSVSLDLAPTVERPRGEELVPDAQWLALYGRRDSEAERCRRLWCAVLVQAVRDLRAAGQEEREAALAFLTETEGELGTVLDLAGLAPGAKRARLRRGAPEGQGPGSRARVRGFYRRGKRRAVSAL